MQERGRGKPRHQRGVLDRIPRVVAAPAHLDVGPVRAEQLPEAEERPRGKRPPARRNEPALVGLAREHRAGRERERDRQPDIAEVQHRRVRNHVRVLEARRQPGPVERRRLRVERARDGDEHEREERGDAAEHRDDPRGQVAQKLAVQRDGKRSVAGEHEQPQEQRPFLPAPKRAQRVGGRQRAVRVRGDIHEREVVAHEGGREHDRGDQRGGEAAVERVARGRREPPPVRHGRRRARDERIHREPEADDEGRTAEVSHQLPPTASTSSPCTWTGTS